MVTRSDPTFSINERTGRGTTNPLGPSDRVKYQSYSGTDIKAAIYLPLLTQASANGTKESKFKVFSTLQTISISSTRSIAPVRVLGRSSPLAYTRGARTIAGTLVFATLNTEVFSDIYDVGMAESVMNAGTSLVADQMPPFSIIITAANEVGAVSVTAVHGVTLVNFGTTYSIDDMYTEETYSFVATDMVPLLSDNTYYAREAIRKVTGTAMNVGKSVTDLVLDSMRNAYGTLEDLTSRIQKSRQPKKASADGLEFMGIF